jgi:WD40 repeat protein
MKRTLSAVVALCLVARAAAETPSYEREVAPILRTYCAGCHNDADGEGELSVERFASLRKGGAGSGDPVTPGDAEASVMIQRIRSTDGDHMPPADEPQPTAADVDTLVRWIAAGAAGPAVDASILQTLVVPKLPPHAGIKPVTALALAADPPRLAIARGRSVEVIGLGAGPIQGGAALLSLPNPPGTVTAVHFSNDGRRLVVAGGIAGLTGSAEIRDAATGAVARAFGGHRDLLYDAELSPDGNTLATAGYDRSIKLWNVADGALVRSIDVHNGAVFDLAWHPTGKLLASASADETVKLWRTADGVRLDTLNQPQAEVFAVDFATDGRHVIAAGRDRRIHLWKLVSLDAPAINPSLVSRFAHESQIVAMGQTADGRHLVTSAEDRSLKCWSLPDLVLEKDLPRQSDLVSAFVPRGEAGFVIGRMDGSLDTLAIAANAAVTDRQPASSPAVAKEEAAASYEAAASGQAAAIVAATVDEKEPDDVVSEAMAIAPPVVIKGTIGRPGDADCFRFPARAGVPLLLETDAARSKSLLDSKIEVLDASGSPVERVVLQATRDSWFTFRGKDSTQSSDFRLQNWMEMELDEYVYANGEVVRLFQYPEGPDSGFWVYPGQGNRHTYFGTTAVTHALGEPAWVVTPLPPGSRPTPNGLPVFRIFQENDDETTRRLKTDSRLLFTPPADGDYVVRVTDVRGSGSQSRPDDYHYALTVRPPRPSFTVWLGGTSAMRVSPGSGREIGFEVGRDEGFEGPVRVAIEGLPPGFTFHGPIEIEAGQIRAVGVLSAEADAVEPDEQAKKAVRVTATAIVGGREVTQTIGPLRDLTLGSKPRFTIQIVPADDRTAGARRPGEPLEFTIRPGQTIPAKVRAVRHDFKELIELGRFGAGRNLPHGVFIDNLGLNGLMIVEGTDEREFFITASPIAKPGKRLFHLHAPADGGHVSSPAVINVVAP